MTTRKHTGLKVVRGARPNITPAKAGPKPEPPVPGALLDLHRVVSLLKVSVSALGENSAIGFGPAELADIAETIAEALTRLQGWLKQADIDDMTRLWQALDVLTLAHAAADSGLNLSTGGLTVVPVVGGLVVAIQTLEEQLASSMLRSWAGEHRRTEKQEGAAS